MGTKDTRAAHGAAGKKDMLLFDPDKLVLVEEPEHDLYDERVKWEPAESMILNIMTYGVLEPVLVRKNTETGQTEVVDGRQRIKACREANKRLRKSGQEPWRVEAVVRRSDAGTAIGMMLSSNEQRFEDTPLNRARKAQRMIERGKTEEEVSVALGVSKTTVGNLLKLIDAPAAVRNAVDAGKITATDGYKLAKLEPDKARVAVDKLVEHAPRTPGKKRSRNAAKAREIMGNKPRSNGKPESKSESKSESDGVRARNQIENAAREISEADKLSGPAKSAIAAFAAWVLGDSNSLDELV